MQGKRGLIMGVANDRSIAWGIAKALHAQGAEIAFSYQGENLEKRVRPLAESIGQDFLLSCDVASEQSIEACFDCIADRWGKIDFLVHAIGFSDKGELRGRFVDISRENFRTSLDISCYSLISATRAALPLMNAGGSILTLTYLGAQKYIPHYNVMGVAKAALEATVRYLAVDLGAQDIRVNAISAGPIKTLAASGISDIREILKWNVNNAPLLRNTTIEDVGSAGLYLISPLSAAVTGEVHYVDCGYNIIGMKNPNSPDID